MWRLGVAQDFYFKSERNFSSNSNTWTRKLTSFLFHMSHDIWKRRCTTLADNKDQTYESQISQNCKTLHIQLSHNPTNLPVKHRHLLDRKSSFTQTSSIRALQSWINRINTGLNLAQSGQKGPPRIFAIGSNLLVLPLFGMKLKQKLFFQIQTNLLLLMIVC